MTSAWGDASTSACISQRCPATFHRTRTPHPSTLAWRDDGGLIPTDGDSIERLFSAGRDSFMSGAAMPTDPNRVASPSPALDTFLRLREIHKRELSAIATLDLGTSEERRSCREKIERLRREWISLCGEYCSAIGAEQPFTQHQSSHCQGNGRRCNESTQ